MTKSFHGQAGALPSKRSVKTRRMGEWVLVGSLMFLTGCDQLGIETPQKANERQLAEAKAIGGACRHAARAIEDCYVLNPKADKSSIYEGWREMDEYMRENKLEGIKPVVPRPAPVASAPKVAPKPSDDEESLDESAAEEKPAAKPKKGNSSH